MGHRANLAIGNETEYELFYSHWIANVLPRTLFWGPDHAEALIRVQRPVEKTEWLDDGYAEGGVVFDRERKKLILFGGEILRYDVPFRRMFLEMMHAVWEGWTIEWAYEGQLDIAEYCGIPRETVYVEEEIYPPDLDPPKRRSGIEGVVSIQDGDVLQLYPVDCLWSHVLSGSGLVDVRHSFQAYESIKLSEWVDKYNRFPDGGLHINITNKTFDYWLADKASNYEAIVAEQWSGWQSTWHKDRFETQLERTQGRLVFNEPTRDSVIARVEWLMDGDEPKPVISQRTDAHLEDTGAKIGWVNPLSLRDDRLPMSPELRRKILNFAVATVSQRTQLPENRA